MAGAGIFSLPGAAGEVAGAAVWLSFLIAGVVALLQGCSFAKFGARIPSATGLLEYVVRGFGNGHVTGIIAPSTATSPSSSCRLASNRASTIASGAAYPRCGRRPYASRSRSVRGWGIRPAALLPELVRSGHASSAPAPSTTTVSAASMASRGHTQRT
jgi:amino acid transporter